MLWTYYWLFIAISVCAIAQFYNQRLAASLAALWIFGCLIYGIDSKVDSGSSFATQPVSFVNAPPFYVATADVEESEWTYHRPGCPLCKRSDVMFRNPDEAQWAGFYRPCTFCLSPASVQQVSLTRPPPRTTAD